jgi:hypothetical protein
MGTPNYMVNMVSKVFPTDRERLAEMETDGNTMLTLRPCKGERNQKIP